MAERTRTGRISAINGALRRASLFGALAAIGAAAFAQTPPPVYQQGDRWTAWNPPTPPEGAEVYTIVSGDSLWSIASSQLGDPYLWPQIWELNSYIADAHWIYPGDPLVMPSATQAVADAAGDPLEDAAQVLADGGQLPVDDGSGDPLDSLLDGDGRRGGGWDPSFAGQGGKSAPVPLGFESDIYCSGYIGEIDESFPYAIAASEYEFLQPTLDPQRERAVKGLHGSTETEKVGLATGDIVYVEGGRADGLSAGELLTIVDPRDAIDHPINNKAVGRYYAYTGRVRVLSVQEETAIAEIVRSCAPITVGSSLRLFEPEPVPLRRRTPMRPVNFPASNDQLDDAPIILSSIDSIISFGAGYLVFIDQGENQDVLPGDVFTIYRRGRRGYPPIVLGELGILSVRGETALGRILESRHSVFIGDPVVIK